MALGKRYEIYLPVEYNPDEHGNRLLIEEEKFDQTHEELWREFRGITLSPESENQALRGLWLNESDQLFKDRVFTIIVYATDINRVDSFFSASTQYLQGAVSTGGNVNSLLNSRKSRIKA